VRRQEAGRGFAASTVAADGDSTGDGRERESIDVDGAEHGNAFTERES